MKKMIGILAVIVAFSAEASNKQTSVETVVTCEERDGDQWIEIGIGLNDGPGLRAYVVAHDIDDGSAKLVFNSQVFESKKDGKTVYEDSFKTIRLIVSKKSHSLNGNLSVIQDGPGGFTQEGLLCFEKSSITFDRK
jgi:hypothetical protein